MLIQISQGDYYRLTKLVQAYEKKAQYNSKYYYTKKKGVTDTNEIQAHHYLEPIKLQVVSEL